MKKFERDGKFNFVDDKNVFVGYSSEQSCCEDADWTIAKKLPLEFDEDWGWCPIDCNKETNTEGYEFDKNFFEELKIEARMDDGGAVAFRLVKQDYPELFLILYNRHNGYYSHGFEVKHGGETVKTGSL